MKRVLIVRLGALGDVVHAIPVAAALRRAWPQARIDWLVSAKHCEILELVPVIDRRLVIHDRPSVRREPHDSRAVHRGLSLLSAIRQLRDGRYDVVLDLQGLIKSAALARCAGAARVIGFSPPYARERLARLFYSDVFDPGRRGVHVQDDTQHIVALNLALLEALDIRGAKVEFPIEHVASEGAMRVAHETGGRYALLNPGAAWPNKRWPPSRYASLARLLRERTGLESVVLWGPGERALAEETVGAAAGAATIAPQTTVADLVALARGASLMISGDTGPLHIASAVGTPIVGVYGPTRPSRNGPLSTLDISVSRDEICQCHHLRRCTRERMCLLDIEVEEVMTAVERRLAPEPSRV